APTWYWTWKRMNMRSLARPVPGIDPRTPITRGKALVLQTSTVAQRWRDCTAAGALGLALAAPTAGAAGAARRRRAAAARRFATMGTASTIARPSGARAGCGAGRRDGVEWSPWADRSQAR